MTFHSDWFSSGLTLWAWVVWVLVLVFCARQIGLNNATPTRMSWALSAVLLVFLWLMSVDLSGGHLNGMSYHLLALNFVCLMLGAPLAFLLGSTWLLALGIAQQGTGFINVFALNALLVVAPACAVNVLLRRMALRFLPKQLFIYIFINGFISGALSMLLTGAGVSALLQGANVFSGSVVWESAFPVFFLLSWGEAFLSGIGTAVCVAFKPEWLQTFDDAVYLQKRNQIWK